MYVCMCIFVSTLRHISALKSAIELSMDAILNGFHQPYYIDCESMCVLYDVCMRECSM